MKLWEKIKPKTPLGAIVEGIIATIVGGLILTWLQVITIESVSQFLKMSWGFVVTFLQYGIPIWIVFLGVVFILVSNKIHQKVSPEHKRRVYLKRLDKNYNSDIIYDIKWRWKWRYNEYRERDKYEVVDLKPICIECDMAMKEWGSIWTHYHYYQCVKCGQRKDAVNQDDVELYIIESKDQRI